MERPAGAYIPIYIREYVMMSMLPRVNDAFQHCSVKGTREGTSCVDEPCFLANEL
jgi:hypothetical protein